MIKPLHIGNGQKYISLILERQGFKMPWDPYNHCLYIFELLDSNDQSYSFKRELYLL